MVTTASPSHYGWQYLAKYSTFQESSLTDPQNYNPFSYRFNYRTGLDKFIKHGKLSANTRFLAGLHMNKVGLEKSDYRKKNRFYTTFKACTDQTKVT